MSCKFDGKEFLFSTDCGFSDSDADIYRYSDGSISYHGDDGSDGYKYSDGSAYYHGADGSDGYKYSDGSGYFRGADGSDGYKYSDGSGYFTYPDGSRYEVKKSRFVREQPYQYTETDYKVILISMAFLLLMGLISLGMFFYFELKG